MGSASCDGLFDGAVGDGDAPWPRVEARLWVGGAADLAGAEDENAAARRAWPKIFLGEVDSDRADRGGAPLDIGVRADAFSDAEGALEEPVERASGGALLLGERCRPV